MQEGGVINVLDSRKRDKRNVRNRVGADKACGALSSFPRGLDGSDQRSEKQTILSHLTGLFSQAVCTCISADQFISHLTDQLPTHTPLKSSGGSWFHII